MSSSSRPADRGTDVAAQDRKMSRPQRILLDAAMDALGACGKSLRAEGWDATMSVHTLPELHVTLTVPINVGPIPADVLDRQAEQIVVEVPKPRKTKAQLEKELEAERSRRYEAEREGEALRRQLDPPDYSYFGLGDGPT